MMQGERTAMLEPGTYADTFRALSASITQVKGRNIGIVDRGDHVEVSWLGDDGVRHERHFNKPDLASLREWGKKLRGAHRSAPTGITEAVRSLRDQGIPDAVESLRTLGQILDERAAEEIAIAEMTGGYWVSWNSRGAKVSMVFARDELTARALRYQTLRG